MSLPKTFFRSLLMATMLALITPTMLAQDVYPTGPEAGKELAAQLSALCPDQNQSWNGTLKIYPRNKDAILVPISGTTTLTDSNWFATYEVKGTPAIPAERLKIVFFTNAPPQYFYSRAVGTNISNDELKQVANKDADIPFAGSDFWLSDLGFEFFHWPDHIRQKGHVHRTRSCYLLDCINKDPSPSGYSKVSLWIDKESGQPMDAEAYGTDKKHLKDFQLGSVEKVNGHYQVKELKMLNSKTGSHTELAFDLKGQ